MRRSFLFYRAKENPRHAERAGLYFSTAAGGGRREKSKGAAVGRDRGACDEGKCREPQVGSPSAPAKKTGQSKTVLFFIQSEGLVCNPA